MSKNNIATPVPGTYKETNPKCNCCDRESNKLSVLCSGLGAVSFAYCDECANQGAEPLGMIEALLEDVPLEGIREEYKNSISFYREGKYILLKDYTKE